MFGYRARIGFISPSVIELRGYDFYRIAPPGVGMIAVTCMVEGWEEDAYKEALAQVDACGRELARRSCDFVVHAGAPLVLAQGKGYETSLIERIQALTGVPATTAIVAAMESFKDLAISRLALVDPYPPDLNAQMVGYLKEWGFDVRAVRSLGTEFTKSSVASVADIYHAARKAVEEAGDAQGIFIPCTNFPVVDVIDAIETDTGIPVIANVTSQMYVALKTIGVRERIEGYGKLLQCL